MTGTTRSSEGLDVRRRKLLFRSWHRGMREMDLIMGRFADATVGQLTQEELTEFEQLMEVPDRELLAWVTGEAAVPADHDTALFRRLRDFNPPNFWFRAARSRWGASQTAPKGSLFQISRVPLRHAATRRQRALSSYAATGRAWPHSRALSASSPLILSSNSFRPGIVCPMTGSRHMRASSPNA